MDATRPQSNSELGALRQRASWGVAETSATQPVGRRSAGDA